MKFIFIWMRHEEEDCTILGSITQFHERGRHVGMTAGGALSVV
jgi:hypothetical protein